MNNQAYIDNKRREGTVCIKAKWKAFYLSNEYKSVLFDLLFSFSSFTMFIGQQEFMRQVFSLKPR